MKRTLSFAEKKFLSSLKTIHPYLEQWARMHLENDSKMTVQDVKNRFARLCQKEGIL